MAITLTELLEEIGDDNTYAQMLDQCITGLRRFEDHNRITFGTDADFTLEGTEKFGIVVWCKREDLKAARDRLLHRDPSPFSDPAPDEEDSR